MSVLIARTFIIYAVLLLTMRLSGKRQLSELEISEFVLASLAADMAALPLESLDIPLINGILPVLCLFCFEIILVGAGLRWAKLREILYGKPSILIKNGLVLQNELRKNRISIEELLAQLRIKGCCEPAELQYAILERDGSLSVFFMPGKRAPLNFELGLAGEPVSLKSTLISQGKLDTEKLKSLGFSEAWLQEKLKELGINSASELFFLSADEKGELYFIKKEDGK